MSRTSCSRYHPQICMLPPCSSMHLVNCSVAPWQLLPQLLLVCALCACVDCAGSGALLPDPPNRLLMPLPTTWPIDEPMATPLLYVCVCAHHSVSPSSFFVSSKDRRKGKKIKKLTQPCWPSGQSGRDPERPESAPASAQWEPPSPPREGRRGWSPAASAAGSARRARGRGRSGGPGRLSAGEALLLLFVVRVLYVCVCVCVRARWIQRASGIGGLVLRERMVWR